MTGDGLTHATKRLATQRSRLRPEETYRLIQAFVDSQDLAARATGIPSQSGEHAMTEERPLVQRLHEAIQQVSLDFRESL